MKVSIFSTLILLCLSHFAQAGCLDNLQSRASSDIARYKLLYSKGELTRTEYNSLIGGAAALVKMRVLTCEGTPEADFSQDQINQLVVSIQKNKLY